MKANKLPTRAGQLLRELLEKANSSKLLPMLTARERLFLTIEICLGHTPVRGGRTRDYPFSEDREKACELVKILKYQRFTNVQLSKAPHLHLGEKSQVPISWLDLIVAMQVLLVSHLQSSTINKIDTEVLCSQILSWLIDEVLSEDFAEAEYILGLLGIPWDRQTSERRGDKYKSIIRLAQKLAAAAYLHHITQISTQELHALNTSEHSPTLSRTCAILNIKPDEVSLILTPNLRILGIRSKHVQSILNDCLRVHIQRGASFWISQNLARIRDSFFNLSAEQHPWGVARDCLTLMLDNDAKTVLLMPEPIKEDRSVINWLEENLFQEGTISQRWVSDHFPRLSPYWDEAKKSNGDMQGCLPDIELQITKRICPLELALDRCIDYNNPSIELKLRLETSLTNFSGNTHERMSDSLPQERCSGIRLRKRLKAPAHIPTWMHSHKNEGYSFAGIAYSLSAISYAKLTSFALAKTLSSRTNKALQPVDKQKELSEEMKTDNPSGAELILLKLDGEKVGEVFTNLPTLSRPGMSILLESLMREALLGGLQQVVMDRLELRLVPALIVYFGGDDLLLMLAKQDLKSFLVGFEKNLESSSPELLSLKFTFATVSAVSRDADEDVIHDASNNLPLEQVNEALTRAKEIRRTRHLNSKIEPDSTINWYDGARVRGLICE